MMKNKKRNFLLIWILALALLLNVLAFVPVVAADEGRDLLKAEYADEEEFKATLKLFVLKDGDERDINDGDTINIGEIDGFRYEFIFEIDDGFEFIKDDYVSLDLSELNESLSLTSWVDENDGDIKFGDYEAGTHTLDDHGVVKITFDKNIEGINDLTKRSGYAYGNFSIEDTGDDLFEEITIPFKVDASITFYIRRTNNATSDIAKLGEWDEENDVIVWTIDVNTKLEDLTNVVLTDVIPDGLIFESVEVFNLEVKAGGLEGITENGSFTNIKYEVAEDGREIKIELEDLVHKAKRVKITTSFESGFGGEQSFTNNASWTATNRTSKVVSDTVKTDRLETIGKSVEAVRGTHKIKWTINYVGDGETSKITDVLKIPDGLMVSLVGSSVSLPARGDGSDEPNFIAKMSTDSKAIEITFDNLPYEDGETYTITYETETFYDGEDEAKNFTLSNEATYDESSSTAEIEVEKKSVLTKEMTDIRVDSGETYVYWTIEINENNECWNDVVLTEFIPKGFEFAGAERKENNVFKKLDPSSNNNNNEVTFNLGKISTKKTIRITTRLTDPSAFSGDNTEKIKNEAKVEWNLCGDGTGIGIGSGTSERFSKIFEAGFDKKDLDPEMWKSGTGITLNGNKTTGIASWEIYYITFKNTLDVENDGFTIADELIDKVEGHKYLKDSFKLDLNGYNFSLPEGNEVTAEATSNDGVTINYSLTFEDGNTEFTLTINSAEKSGNQSIINDYANIVILTYESEVPLANLEDVTQDSNEKNTLKNKATVSNKNVEDITKYGSNKFDNTFSKNGKKSADKKDQTHYKWTVDLNYKSKTFGAGETIEDDLTGKHRYVKDTLEIYEAELTNDDLHNEDGEPIEPILSNDGTEPLIKGTDYTVNFGKDKDDNAISMTITFLKEITHPIIIEYETEAFGIADPTYSNEVTFNKKTYSDSVTRNNFNEFIEKSSDVTGTNVKIGDIINWEIEVNKSLSEILDFKLTDKISDGQILIDGSLKVLSSDKTAEVNLTAKNLELITTTNPLGFELKSSDTTEPVSEHFYVQYQTLVIKKDGVSEISNKAKVTGTELEDGKTSSKSYTIIARGGAGFTGTLRSHEYLIKLFKVEPTGEGKTQRIHQEVTFTLRIETTVDEKPLESIVETITTDAYGYVELVIEGNQGNITREYFIKEIIAPDGYLLSDKEIEINFPADPAERTIEIEILNIFKTEVTVTKVWEGGLKNRKSIEVQLLRGYEDGDATEPLDTVELNEDNNWTYTWEDLEATDSKGNAYIYTVEEVDDLEYFESSVAGPREGDEPNSFVITNTYQASGEWSPKVTKRLDGRRLKNKEFEFELELQKQQPAPSSAVVPMSLDDPATSTEHVSVDDINDPLKETNNASGAVAFGPITFNENHIGKTFEFIIREGKPSFPEGGMRYDENEYKVVVEVKDAGDGKLNFITTYYQRGTPDQEWVDLEVDANKGITFRNIYSAGNAWTPNVTKELVGRELKDKEFEFVLKGPQGNVLEKVKNDADGNVTFGYIAYNQSDIGGSYTYTIEEIVGDEPGMSYDTRPIEITVSISDAGGGVLNINAIYPAVTTFVNRYSGPSGITVTANKVWKDLPSGWTEHLPTIWFKLYRSVEGGTAEAVPGLAMQKLPAGVTQVSWNGLEKYDPDGKLYVYSVKEVDENGDDYEPKYFEKTEKGLTITNAFIKERVEGDEDFDTKIDVTGHKAWKGVPKGQTVPTIWLKLYRHIEGGTPVAVPGRPIMELRPGVTQGTWKDLEKVDEDYNYYIYTVKEVDSKGNDYEPPLNITTQRIHCSAAS